MNMLKKEKLIVRTFGARHVQIAPEHSRSTAT